MPTILFVERDSGHSPSLVSALRHRPVAVVVENDFRSAIANMATHEPDLIVLDAASMRTSGVRIARCLIQARNGVPLIRIAPTETSYTNSHENEFLLIQPFSLRRLVTLSTRLLPPVTEHELHIGPVSIDTKSRTVRSRGRCTLLTPKTMALLLYLHKNGGRLVTRERLMKHVWGTDYIGDTRTIDVHVSWLRKAIEEDPKSPQYLKTIRGVGLRLESG